MNYFVLGYWLKDPFRVEPPSWHVVDYRTERYRLDDLLLMKDKDGSKSIWRSLSSTNLETSTRAVRLRSESGTTTNYYDL